MSVTSPNKKGRKTGVVREIKAYWISWRMRTNFLNGSTDLFSRHLKEEQGEKTRCTDSDLANNGLQWVGGWKVISFAKEYKSTQNVNQYSQATEENSGTRN